ncbi:MAG: CRTAC1 family protein, partial [Planctomycetes bacterium]|nr:CRTAC1 family protein [Planctomycetota bacterium]
GASVSVTVGPRRRLLDVRAAFGYQSSSDPVLHVGLGAEAAARDVRVRWIDGSEESFGDVPAGRRQVLRRGAGRP